MSRAISKILSPNDTGETGGHQAGILIPKDPEILDFFPPLDATERNPRYHLPFFDDSGGRWDFAFIYYNNRFFGGTRNEFRLTHMTSFVQMNGLKSGDELILKRNLQGMRLVTYKRARQSLAGTNGVLRLGSQWKVIKY